MGSHEATKRIQHTSLREIVKLHCCELPLFFKELLLMAKLFESCFFLFAQVGPGVLLQTFLL